MTVVCNYCRGDAKLVKASTINPKGYGLIWECSACDAYTTCLGDSDKPMGTLANKRLRALRRKLRRKLRNGIKEVNINLSDDLNDKSYYKKEYILRITKSIWEFDENECNTLLNVIKQKGE